MNKRGISKPAILILALILLTALVLRGLVFLDFKNDMALKYDPRNYWLMSHQLVDDGIYGYWYDNNPFGGEPGVSNARVTPGYPVFLAIVYKIVGDKYLQITAVRLLQIIIGSMSSLLAFIFIRKIFNKEAVALITAFFVAVYPTYIFSSVQLLTEVLALFTLLLYFCLLAYALDTKSKWLNFLTGSAFALHILVRPALLPLFILPFIFILISNRARKKTSQDGFPVKKPGRLFLLQLAGFVLVMAPWWIRNIITLGSFIITAKASGNPLLGGTYPYFSNYFADVPDEIRGNNDGQQALAIKRIIEGFKTQPILYLKWFTVGKTKYIFEKPYLYNMVASTQTLHFITHFFIIISGVLGMIWHAIKSSRAIWFYLYGLAILALQLLFVPDPRFAYLIFFFIMTGAAHFLVFLFELVTGKNNRKVREIGS